MTDATDNAEREAELLAQCNALAEQIWDLEDRVTVREANDNYGPTCRRCYFRAWVCTEHGEGIVECKAETKLEALEKLLEQLQDEAVAAAADYEGRLRELRAALKAQGVGEVI